MFLCPFCASEYFIRITKQKYNKRKETKKTSNIPKDGKSEMMKQHLSQLLDYYFLLLFFSEW